MCLFISKYFFLNIPTSKWIEHATTSSHWWKIWELVIEYLEIRFRFWEFNCNIVPSSPPRLKRLAGGGGGSWRLWRVWLLLWKSLVSAVVVVAQVDAGVFGVGAATAWLSRLRRREVREKYYSTQPSLSPSPISTFKSPRPLRPVSVQDCQTSVGPNQSHNHRHKVITDYTKDIFNQNTIKFCFGF